MPSGIDNLTIIIRDNQLSKEGEELLLKRLKKELSAESVVIDRDLVLIMIVGEGMCRKIGTMSKVATAFAENKINIDMVNQGASEVSVMYGISADKEKLAIKALYHAFFE